MNSATLFSRTAPIKLFFYRLNSRGNQYAGLSIVSDD